MTLKLYQVQPLIDTLISLSKQELPIALAYKLSKLKSLLQSDSEFFGNEASKIINQYCEKKDDGSFVTTADGNFTLKKEYMEIANRKMKELENTESTTDIDVTFSLEDFGDIKMKPSDLDTLLPFIKD